MKIEDYRLAPSGLGPLAHQWGDKPHRLVYDLVTEIERLREILRELANCGYSPHVHGVDWVEVQVDWDEWKTLDEFREKPAPEAGW